MDGGKSEANAIQIAWGVLRNWASGRGKVTAETRAKAVRLLAELDALRARAHATPDSHNHSITNGKALDMAMPQALAQALAAKRSGTTGVASAGDGPRVVTNAGVKPGTAVPTRKLNPRAQAIHDKLVAKGVKPAAARVMAVRAATRPAKAATPKVRATNAVSMAVTPKLKGTTAVSMAADPGGLDLAMAIATRRKLAASGNAIPDGKLGGRFPITSRSSLRNAIAAHGRARPEDQAKVARHIVRQARRMGATDMVTPAITAAAR